MPYVNINGSKVWVGDDGKIDYRNLDKTHRYGNTANYTPKRDKGVDAVGDPAGPITRPPDDYNFDAYSAYKSNVAGQLGGSKSYNITPGQAEAYARMVEQGELSQYQLDQILGSNSPLMRRAGAMGQALAGQRGLMNSSLAAGAAQGAMVDRAQPFALSDADAYRMAATENLSAKNQASLTNAQLMTQANIAKGELGGAYDRTLLQAKAQAMMEEAQRMWQTGENTENRRWQTSERLGSQDWQTGERLGSQDWQSGENAAQRDWQTGERIGGQDWQSGENQLNRDWTSEENMHQRMQDWAITQLQTYASIGMNREQAMMQVLANIYSNPNLTASEQRAAAANAQQVYQQLYSQPWTPPQGLTDISPYGSSTNTQPGMGIWDQSPVMGNVNTSAPNPDAYDWGQWGAAGDVMRQNYIAYYHQTYGRGQIPMHPDEWLASGGGKHQSYTSTVNPNASSVTGDLPDV